jgi:phosphopantetheinyl transferase (holo-ACP synthase)
LLVGNDVVDLHDRESRSEALHPRFDIRVFAADEREALRASSSAHPLRWTLWAAKESAYKVAKKLDPAVRFLPRDFVVRGVGEGQAVVMHETGPFDVQLHRTDQWVSAVATRTVANARSTRGPVDGGPVSSGIEHLGTHGADPSRTVREFARAALALRMNLPPGQIRIATDRGIPVALWRDRKLPVDLSLSHHGRFVAWAWVARRLGRRSRLLEALPQGVHTVGFSDDREPVPTFEHGSSPRDHHLGPASDQGDQGALRQEDIL